MGNEPYQQPSEDRYEFLAVIEIREIQNCFLQCVRCVPVNNYLTLTLRDPPLTALPPPDMLSLSDGGYSLPHLACAGRRPRRGVRSAGDGAPGRCRRDHPCRGHPPFQLPLS